MSLFKVVFVAFAFLAAGCAHAPKAAKPAPLPALLQPKPMAAKPAAPAAPAAKLAPKPAAKLAPKAKPAKNPSAKKKSHHKKKHALKK